MISLGFDSQHRDVNGSLWSGKRIGALQKYAVFDVRALRILLAKRSERREKKMKIRCKEQVYIDMIDWHERLQVFSSLTDTIPIQSCRSIEEGIDEICWLVCRKYYLDRPNPQFKDSSVYQLFRIFCLLAEIETDGADSAFLVSTDFPI